jgi:hypothetical protein
MTLLKNEKKKDEKLIGVLMSSSVSSFLNLYTLAKSTTKSNIIRPLIEDWIAVQRQQYSDEELLQEIIHRVDLQWKVEKKTKPNLSFAIFKDSLELELSAKLPKEYVECIIKEIE